MRWYPGPVDSTRDGERDSLTSDMNATATIRNRSGEQLPLKCGSSRSFPKKPECLRGGGNAVSHSESAVVARWKDVTGPKHSSASYDSAIPAIRRKSSSQMTLANEH